MYSYVKPKKKSPFTKEVILVITFFFVAFFMLFSTYGFLIYKDYSFKKDITATLDKKEKLKKDIALMNQDITFIETQSNLANKIYTTNSVLKDSISNLFDLVPDRITLSKAQILKNGLILYGITPSKEIYEYMLEAPLKSIFSKTYTSYYQLDNGWLSFVSTNYLDDFGELEK
jgi:hypothetical protein